MEDQLLSIEQVSVIEKSLQNIKKELKSKKKVINDIMGDIIGESEIKLNDMREKIGLSVED